MKLFISFLTFYFLNLNVSFSQPSKDTSIKKRNYIRLKEFLEKDSLHLSRDKKNINSEYSKVTINIFEINYKTKLKFFFVLVDKIKLASSAENSIVLYLPKGGFKFIFQCPSFFKSKPHQIIIDNEYDYTINVFLSPNGKPVSHEYSAN